MEEKSTLLAWILLTTLILIVGPCSFQTGRFVGSMEEKDFWKDKIRKDKIQDLMLVVEAEDAYLRAMQGLREANAKSGISTIESY